MSGLSMGRVIPSLPVSDPTITELRLAAHSMAESAKSMNVASNTNWEAAYLVSQAMEKNIERLEFLLAQYMGAPVDLTEAMK